MRITFRKQLLWLISVAALAVASASFASVFGPQSEKKSPASSFDETMLPGPDIITGASLVALPNRPVRIARIVLPELPSTLQATQVTADLLKKAFWPHSVEFETLTSGALTERIREGSVDAFVASSGYYWRMTQYGATAVGTLISDRQPDPNNATALAFLVRAKDERFNELYDLKGYSVGSTFATAFMTYRIGLAEIAKLGEDPENFFAQTVFTQRTDNSEVVSLLDRGLVDAVMVKACWLEAQPTEVQSRYRVLAPRFGGIGCKHSTDTYPGIMMARHTRCASDHRARHRPYHSLASPVARLSPLGSHHGHASRRQCLSTAQNRKLRLPSGNDAASVAHHSLASAGVRRFAVVGPSASQLAYIRAGQKAYCSIVFSTHRTGKRSGGNSVAFRTYGKPAQGHGRRTALEHGRARTRATAFRHPVLLRKPAGHSQEQTHQRAAA